MRPRLSLLLFVVVTALLAIGAPSCCATGEVWDDEKKKCVCKPDHVPDEDGKGCHLPDAPPTTTTTTTLPPSPSPIASPTSEPPPPPTCDLPPMPESGGPEDPAGSGHWGACWEERPSHYLGAVQDAVEEVKGWPGMLLPSGQVSHEDAYMDAVIGKLRQKGYCVTRGGPEDEIGVKLSNSWSEQFDILWSSDNPRRPWSNHTVSCVPSRF